MYTHIKVPRGFSASFLLGYSLSLSALYVYSGWSRKSGNEFPRTSRASERARRNDLLSRRLNGHRYCHDFCSSSFPYSPAAVRTSVSETIFLRLSVSLFFNRWTVICQSVVRTGYRERAEYISIVLAEWFVLSPPSNSMDSFIRLMVSFLSVVW